MPRCLTQICARCEKEFRSWGSSNLCVPCYEATVEPDARAEEFKNADREMLYGGELEK